MPVAGTGNNTNSGGHDTAHGGGSSPQQMITWAQHQLGTQEGSSKQVRWAQALGYSPSIPWCSIFVGYGLKFVCGMSLPPNPAYSGDWEKWSQGKKVNINDHQPGDLIIYDWGDGGQTDHVALDIGGGERIGGNQSNAVTKEPIDLAQAVAVVRPDYAHPGDAGSIGGGGTSGGSFSESDLFAIGRASAFSTQLNLPGMQNEAESIMMTGAKSIFNDEPVMQFIQQLCQASLRSFQSLPNGAFFAFFPDQFGLYGHRKPYWAIEDIEIVDGGIDMTDEALATHVFVVGDTNFNGSIDLGDMTQSRGVVTIFDYFGAGLIAEEQPKTQKQADKKQLTAFNNAVEFLRKYGQRPLYQEAPFIRNSFFEIFYAYSQFEILWANQFRTTFSFTFMPELYPGGRVAFPNHDLQCYIDNVTHTFDYESGFLTQANLSAPSATKNSDMARGMLTPFTRKALPFLPQLPAPKDGNQKDKGKK